MSSFGGKIGQLGENYCGSNNFRSAADENYSPYLHLLKKGGGRKFGCRQFYLLTPLKLAKVGFRRKWVQIGKVYIYLRLVTLTVMMDLVANFPLNNGGC